MPILEFTEIDWVPYEPKPKDVPKNIAKWERTDVPKNIAKWERTN